MINAYKTGIIFSILCCLFFISLPAYAEEGVVGITFNSLSPQVPEETKKPPLGSGGGLVSGGESDDDDDVYLKPGKPADNVEQKPVVPAPAPPLHLGELPKTGSDSWFAARMAFTNYLMLVTILALPRRRKRQKAEAQNQ